MDGCWIYGWLLGHHRRRFASLHLIIEGHGREELYDTDTTYSELEFPSHGVCILHIQVYIIDTYRREQSSRYAFSHEIELRSKLPALPSLLSVCTPTAINSRRPNQLVTAPIRIRTRFPASAVPRPQPRRQVLRHLNILRNTRQLFQLLAQHETLVQHPARH